MTADVHHTDGMLQMCTTGENMTIEKKAVHQNKKFITPVAAI
jgi:hypothetical protein